MNTSSATAAVWEWSPTISAESKKKMQRIMGGGALVIIASVAAAVALQSRFVIVLAVLVVGIGLFWSIEHRRLMSTRCTVTNDGQLTITDSRSSMSADLGAADNIDVRHRSSGSGGVSASGRWSIEVAGPSGASVFSLANVAGSFNLPEIEAKELEADLRRLAVECGAANLDAAGGTARDAAPSAAALLAMSAPTAHRDQPTDRFEWQPRLSPNADRNRTLMRAAFVVPAIGIAIYAVVAYWDEGLVAVLLSAATVPTLLLLCGLGLDVAMNHGRSFRVIAEDGQLAAGRPKKQKTFPLTGSTVAVEIRNQTTHTGSGTSVHSARWHLDVTTPDGEQGSIAIPSFGTATTRQDYVALERELQRRT